MTVRRSLLSGVAALVALAATIAPAVASHQGDSINDLRVTQSDSPDPVIEGGFVEYTFAVSNLGPHPAQNVVLEHSVPNATTVAATGQRWECAISEVLNRTTCVHHGALPSGSSARTLRIVAQAPGLAIAPSITSTADVTSHGSETDPVNNHSVEVTTIEEGDDLVVSQFDEPFVVTSTHLVHYAVHVSNEANTEATGVTLTENVSGGTVEGASGDGWTCSTTASSASCTLDSSLSAEQASRVDVFVRAPTTTSDSTITAVANVSGTRSDRDTNDNTHTETTEVEGVGRDRATGYIPPAGGYVTTNPTGQFTEPPSTDAGSAFASAATDASPEVASPSDATIGDVAFPVGPGGVASLFEGPSSSQLAVCAVVLVNCAGAALDVIVPPGYNDPNSPILVNLIYDESVAPISEGNRTVYVEKPVNGVPTTVILPECQLLGIANPSPCVDFQTRLADGDLLIRILMLSQDPKYQG